MILTLKLNKAEILAKRLVTMFPEIVRFLEHKSQILFFSIYFKIIIQYNYFHYDNTS